MLVNLHSVEAKIPIYPKHRSFINKDLQHFKMYLISIIILHKDFQSLGLAAPIISNTSDVHIFKVNP